MNELYEMEWRRIYLIPKNFNRNDIYCFRLKKRMKFNCKVILALFMFLSYITINTIWKHMISNIQY